MMSRDGITTDALSANESEADDRIPAVELTQWRVGQVLTEDDIQMLHRFMRESEEEEQYLIDQLEKTWEAALRKIGGQDLVDADKNESAHMVEAATQRALKMFFESLAKKRAGAH